MSVRVTSPNGTIKAERKRFAVLDRKFRGKPEFCVATVDYGTTHCSANYTLYPSDSSKKNSVSVRLDEFRDVARVPNCVLFNPQGKQVKFGYHAREGYRKIADDQRGKFFYFEHVKKTFQHQKVERNTTVVADNGTKFFLLDVIAHTLRYVQKKVTTSLGGALREELHIDWVITVPAIWDAAGKQMMREAGYKAGLCADGNYNIPELKEAQGTNDPIHVEYPDRLSMALEPESAAIQCQQEAKDAHKASTYYIVADIGGGTVDIACHEIVDGFTEERHPALGNDWGGTKVNEEFQHFLEKLVDDNGLEHYIGSLSNNPTKNKARLRETLYTKFEQEKISFGQKEHNDDSDDYVIDFDGTFWSQYGGILKRNVSERNNRHDMTVTVEEDDKQIRVTHEQMAKFFQPAVQGISKLLLELLAKDVGSSIDTVFWVGGFGRCKYLQNMLEGNIRTRFGEHKYKFFTPPQPELAATRGATAFRCEPDVLRMRKADATYGIDVLSHFDERIHDIEHRQWYEELKEYRCKHLFCAFVEKGESINTHEAFVQSFTAMSYNQTSMSLDIYSSPEEDVRYTDDPTAVKLGHLDVRMEGVGLDRSVEVTFDITHTEIQVRAYQKPEGTEVKAVIDFL